MVEISALGEATLAGLPAGTAGKAAGSGAGPVVQSFLDLVQALTAAPPVQAGEAAPPAALLAITTEAAATEEGEPGPAGGPDLASILSLLSPAAAAVVVPPPGPMGPTDPDPPSLRADEAAADQPALPAGIAANRQYLPFPASIEQARLTAEEPAAVLSGPLAAQTPAGAASPAQQALVAAVAPERVAEAIPRAGEAALSAGTRVAAPLNSRDWATECAQRVTWLVGQRVQMAEIAVNPANLGGVEVRLSLHEHGAGAQFYSPHASVRDALEAALPRLRDMLAEAGIALGQAEVRDQAFAPRQQWLGELAKQRAGVAAGGSEETSALTAASAPMRHGWGLIDLYA